jgi:hypothetical protein
LTVTANGAATRAYTLVAQQLARRLNLSKDKLSQDYSISQVIAASGVPRSKLSIYMKPVMDDLIKLPIPEPIQLLAQISAFRVFVSTTFDTWLEQALNQHHFGGASRVISHAYSPQESPDLSMSDLNGIDPVVYRLFGCISEVNYALTDEDMLEYLHRLQAGTPKVLSDMLREHPLLFIGNSFSDWLARFFVRAIRAERLIEARNQIFFIDNEFLRSEALSSFFQGFCRNTATIFTKHTPVEFVRLLHQKWQERRPPVSDSAGSPPSVATVANAAPDSHSIFISYSSKDDSAAANKLFARLQQARLNVWMDRNGGLSGGDDFDRKIEDQIRRCTFFMPVLSHRAEARVDGYFRKEWDVALKRLPYFTGYTDRNFLVPVVVDDLKINGASTIPLAFKSSHCLHAPGGDLSDADMAQLVQTVRRIIKAAAGMQ